MRAQRLTTRPAVLGLGLVVALGVTVSPTGGTRSASAAPSQQPATLQVTATELQPLEGADPGTTQVWDVNDRGQAVGESGNRPVVWEDGRPVALPTVRGDEFIHSARFINDRGQVVIWDRRPQPGGAESAYYMWSDGQVTDMAGVGWVKAFNDLGQALFRGSTPGPLPGQAFPYEAIWEADTGSITEISPPDDLYVEGFDLGDGGHVVGRATRQPATENAGAFMWHGGTFTRLNTFGSAIAVNRSGEAVGVGRTFGMLWSGWWPTTLPEGFYPVDINDDGQIAGDVPAGEGRQAALWDDGRLTPLDGLGARLALPSDINARGLMAGRGLMPDGMYHGMLWFDGKVADLGLGDVLAVNDQQLAVGMWRDRPGAPERPILWEVQDDGGDPSDPTDPPGEQCVSATNAEHVAAGRATSFLVFAWAVGSDEYLGLTSQVTALREAAPGRWELVDGC